MFEDHKYQLPTYFYVKDGDDEDKVNIRPIEGLLLRKGILEKVKTIKKTREKKKEGENRSTNLFFSTQETNKVRIVKLATRF
jgi:hypothetical protein